MELVINRNIFMRDAISPTFICETINMLGSKKNIGGYNIFLGQVRADGIEGKTVKAIEYSAYEGMAKVEINKICENVFERYETCCLQVYHSLGVVEAGEICFFVLAASAHRDAAYSASRFIVEEVKKNVPIFGKEIFEDESFTWKVNK